MTSTFRYKKTAAGSYLVPLVGPEPASPGEVVEAKLDGVCPRCGEPGDFSDIGYCNCGFSY